MLDGQELAAAAADGHYDTPWEFKNRALAAILGQQQRNGSGGAPKSPEGTRQHNNGNNSAAGHKKAQKQDDSDKNGRKRLSLPQAMSGGVQHNKGRSGGQRQRQPPQPPAPPGTVSANGHFQFIQPLKVDPLLPRPSPSTSSVLPTSSNGASGNVAPPPLPAHQHAASGQSPSTSSSPSASSSSASTPPQPPPRHNLRKAAIRKPVPEQQQPIRKAVPEHPAIRNAVVAILPEQPPVRKGTNPQEITATTSHQQQGVVQLRNYPMVAMPTAKEMLDLCQRCPHQRQQQQQCPMGLEEELEQFVHERLDRPQAEHILGPMGLGAHLLRRRADRNLALSLRANEGVLHIKLEFRQGQWVLGDGPRFPSVHSMLRAYRRTELPVRGAAGIRLAIQLRPADLPGGLLLL